jgi:hypothetical protein
MDFVFINHTTLLPINSDAQAFFEKRLDKQFKDEFKNPIRNLERYLGNNPVHFVIYEPEFKDPLGTYTLVDDQWMRPVIKVSPEKIMEHFESNVHQKYKFSNSKIFKKRYLLLVAAVIFHELAHFLMDLTGSESKYARVPIDWAIGRVFDQETLNLNRAPRDGEYYRGLKDEIREDISYIEESLANAIMLKQAFKSNSETSFLVDFVRSQDPDDKKGYKAGLNWTGNLQDTLETANSFAKLKHQIITRNDNDSFIINSEKKLKECRRELSRKCDAFDFKI